MRKERTVTFCDICEMEIQGKSYHCDICGKEICDDCFTHLEWESDEIDVEFFKPFIICNNCGNDDKLENWCRKFFKQIEIKSHLDTIRDKLKIYLIKSIMLDKC